MTDDEDFDIEEFALSPDQIKVRRVTPRRVRKRREKFVQLPWTWVERLIGASGKTWFVAAWLLHQHWKSGGGPIKLANGMLRYDGISRPTKWRALSDLERLGLIAVERRSRRSPIVRVLC